MHINTHNTHGKITLPIDKNQFLLPLPQVTNIKQQKSRLSCRVLYSVQKENLTPNPPTHTGNVIGMRSYYFKATRSGNSSTMVTLTSKLVYQYFVAVFFLGFLCSPMFLSLCQRNYCQPVTHCPVSALGGRGRRHSPLIIIFMSLRISLRFGSN